MGEFFGQSITTQFRVHEVFQLAAFSLFVQMLMFALLFEIKEDFYY